MNTRSWLVFVGAVSGLAMAACGTSGDDGDGGHHDTTNATSTAAKSGVGGAGGAATGGGGGAGGDTSCVSCAEAIDSGVEVCPGTPDDAYYSLVECACFQSSCAELCTDFCDSFGAVSPSCADCLRELSSDNGCPVEYDICTVN